MADAIAKRFNGLEYDASDERAIDAVLLHPGGGVLPRPGRRPGPGLTVTVGGSPETATVAAGCGIVVDPDRDGTYEFTLPTDAGLELAPRPGVGTSRISFVVAQALNEDALPGDGERKVEIVLVEGVAGSSPTAPTLTAGQLRLARLNIPASGTIAVSQPAQRTAAAGGVLIVANAAERALIDPVYDGLQVYNEDLDVIETRSNGGWTWSKEIPLTAPVFTPVSGAWGNITGFSFPAEAGGVYAIDVLAFLLNGASSTPKWKTGWNWTGTGEMSSGQSGLDTGVVSPAYAGTNTGHAILADNASPLRESTGLAAPAGGSVVARIAATYFSATDGTVQMEHAQFTSDPDYSTGIRRGSRMLVRRLA